MIIMIQFCALHPISAPFLIGSLFCICLLTSTPIVINTRLILANFKHPYHVLTINSTIRVHQLATTIVHCLYQPCITQEQ